MDNADNSPEKKTDEELEKKNSTEAKAKSEDTNNNNKPSNEAIAIGIAVGISSVMILTSGIKFAKNANRKHNISEVRKEANNKFNEMLEIGNMLTKFEKKLKDCETTYLSFNDEQMNELNEEHQKISRLIKAFKLKHSEPINASAVLDNRINNCNETINGMSDNLKYNATNRPNIIAG